MTAHESAEGPAPDEADLQHFAQWWAARDERAGRLLDALAAHSDGDPDALGALLRLVLEHGLCRPALRKILVAEHDLEDAEQATLAVVAHRIGQFEGRARFTTWLHQVAVNEARMLIRARARRPSEPLAEEPAGSAYVTRLSTFVANRMMVRQAVDALPEEFRAPLILREYDGLSYEEIAARLDCPVGTVRSRLSRARAALSAQLTVR
jgi:RNA polymerase sigma-70 factor (ECF subfamily)